MLLDGLVKLKSCKTFKNYCTFLYKGNQPRTILISSSKKKKSTPVQIRLIAHTVYHSSTISKGHKFYPQIVLEKLLHILSLWASVITTKPLVWPFDCTRGQVTAAATYTFLICINFHTKSLTVIWRKCNFLWHLLPNIRAAHLRAEHLSSLCGSTPKPHWSWTTALLLCDLDYVKLSVCVCVHGGLLGTHVVPFDHTTGLV